MPATLYPISDISNGGLWTATPSGSLFAAINEDPPNQADYIASPGNPQNAVCEVKVGSGVGVSPLAVSVNALIARTSSNTASLFMALIQGTTVIATQQFTATISPVSVSLKLTGPQMAAITDYSDLRIRFTASTSDAINLPKVQVFAASVMLNQTYAVAASDNVNGQDVYGSPPPASYNWVTNPSVEVATTGWSAAVSAGATLKSNIARITTDNFVGTACLEATYTFSAANQSGGIYVGNQAQYRPINPGDTTYVGIAAKVQAAAVTPVRIQVRVRYLRGDGTYLSEHQVGTDVVTPIVGRWYYLSGNEPAPANAAYASVMTYVFSNGVGDVTLRADAACVSDTLGPYIDGDQPGCVWEGTAHASRSLWLGNAVNLVSNPSFEVDLSTWLASGGQPDAVIARSTAWSYQGAASIRHTATLTAAQSFSGPAQQVQLTKMLAVAGGTYSATVVCNAVALPSGASLTLKIDWYAWDGTSYTNVGGAVTSPQQATLGFQRHSVTGVVPVGATYATVKVFAIRGTADAAVDFNADMFVFTYGTVAPVPFDGSTPGCSWTGAANASPSMQTNGTSRTVVLSRVSSGNDSAPAVDVPSKTVAVQRSAREVISGTDSITNTILNPKAAAAGPSWGPWAGGAPITSGKGILDGPVGGPQTCYSTAATSTSLQVMPGPGDSASGTTAPSTLLANGWVSISQHSSFAISVWMKARQGGGVGNFTLAGYFRDINGTWITSISKPNLVISPTTDTWYLVTATFIAPMATAFAHFYATWSGLPGDVSRELRTTGAIIAASPTPPAWFDPDVAPAVWSGAPNNGASILPTLARATTTNRSVPDNAAAADAPSRTGQYARGVQDTAPALPDGFRTVIGTRTAADTASAADSVFAWTAHPRFTTDVAPAVDSVSRQAIVSRTAQEQMYLVEWVRWLKNGLPYRPTPGHVAVTNAGHQQTTYPGSQ